MKKIEGFPIIKKAIDNYLQDEEGNITRNKIITVGSLAIILGMIYGLDVYAKHGSHESHSSHSSTSYTRSYSSHASHASHESHASHASNTVGSSVEGNGTGTGTTGVNATTDSSGAVETVVTQLTGYEAVYNEAFYILHNPDVYSVLGNDSNALFQHFLNSGMSEGRQASAEFNVGIYEANYPDLVSVYGTDLKSYYIHYITAGKTEGRVAQ